MTASTEILERVSIEHPKVKEAIQKITAELASGNYVITENGEVIAEGETARKMMEDVLDGLIAADKMYDIAKQALQN